MASSSSIIVIKVKYREALRRFKASIVDNKLLVYSIFDNKLPLDIAMLKEKIHNFFSFDFGVEFTMTYVDEDDDVVILADDDDLDDIVGQSLNPLRIFVKLNNGNPAGSTGTSAPSTLSQSQLPHHPFNYEVSQTMQLPLYQPQSQTWNPAAPETPKSSLLKPTYWDLVVPKTPTSPLMTPSWPLVQPQCLQFNPAVPKPPMSPPQPQFEPWTPVFSKTPMSQIIKPELQTRSPVESETLMPQIIKSQSQTVNTGATPMVPGVIELVENMETTDSNQLPASMTSVGLTQLTGGTSNVTGHQDLSSESSTIKNTEVSVNFDIGNFNMLDKQPPKVTEDIKFKDVQPLRFVDQYVKAPNKASNGFESSTVKNKETTDGVKDGKKVVVNHEDENFFSFNVHWYAQCNKCKFHPTAPWFKSKVKENYDLCSTCFEELQGSVADYIRVDKPIIVTSENFGETLVNSFMPPSIKNIEVANQDHLLDTVLPGKNIIKVSESDGSNVDSPHKDQEKNIAIEDLTADKGDESSTMATILTGSAGPAEMEFTMDSPPVGPTVELGTTSLDPISFPKAPPIASGASSSKVAVGRSSAIATQSSSDELEEALVTELEYKEFKQPDDKLVVPPIVSGASSSTVAVGQSSPIATQNGSDEWEKALVTELEYKEFKQLDDQQILSVNKSDFEKTLDDLYSISEWDPGRTSGMG